MDTGVPEEKALPDRLRCYSYIEVADVLESGGEIPFPFRVGGTEMQFMFGSCQQFMGHLEQTVVGTQPDFAAGQVAGIDLDSSVLHSSCIQVHRSPLDRNCLDHVLPLDIVEVYPKIKAVPGQRMHKGEFVVHQPFRKEIGILRGEHVHLSDGWVSESLADNPLDYGGRRGGIAQPQLRYPFATVLLVIVEADSDIQRKAVFQQALLQIQVSGNIVQLDICQHCVVGSVAI